MFNPKMTLFKRNYRYTEEITQYVIAKRINPMPANPIKRRRIMRLRGPNPLESYFLMLCSQDCVRLQLFKI